MADHRNLPHTLLFESQSPSGSKFDENGYGELQNTSVFDDTMVVDSPLDEMGTQLEDVCFDTEVVDHFDDDESIGNLGDLKAESLLCELDAEIVLDSEDEGICKTMNQRTPERSECKALGLRERQIKTPCLDSASIDEQSRAGNKGSTINLDSIDGKKDVPQLSECDHEIGRLECVDSQEPEESSQANALSFVDNFLTFNDMDICQEGEERTSSRKKSPLVSSAKATQRLAKIIKGGSPVKRMGTFDWCESNQHGEADSMSRKMTPSSECGDFGRRTDKSLQNPHINGEKSLRNKHEEKREIAVLHKDIRGPSYSPSNFIEHGAKVRINIEQESGRNFVNGSVKELDEFMQTEPSWEKFKANASARDIPDMFDVGIGTQIAAEAMEALFYGPPPTWKTGDECERREDNIADLPDGETEKRANLDQHSLQNIAASDFADIAKQSIRRKRSSRRYSKVISSSSWKSNYQELNQKIKPKPCKSRQSKVNKNVSSNNQEKCESYASAPISDKDLGIHQSRHLQVGAGMKGTKDQPDKPRVVTNNVEERSMLTYKRKRKRVVADPPKLLSGKQKCSKLYSYASAEASNDKLNKQGQINHQKDALGRFFGSDAWKCPKGKRTHRKVPVHSSGASNKLDSFTNVGAEVHKPHSHGSQKVPEDDENASDNLNKKGLMRTALTQLSLENNSEEGLSRQSCNEEVTGIVTKKASAVTNSRISAWNDRSKAIQTGKPGHADAPTIANGLESHIFVNSQRKSIEQAGTECNTAVSCTKKVNEASFNSVSYVYRRRPCNKNLPKPSLLKELTGLGVPESISDFTRIRTRRQGAHVRVLFSQHLADDIIKQQKKIAGRLGVSITSCSMDATHFIADEFVRTRNMLEAIALGKPVVTHLWLDSCGLVSCLLDEKNYILRDSKREKEIGFSMPVSLARARQYPLLKDKRVCITPNVKPNKEMITSLVKAVGGQVVETSQKLAAKDQKIPDDLLILSCKEDLEICVPLFDKGAAIYSSELLLNGIVIQKLEHERHKLFSDFVKRKRTISERDRQTRSASKR